MKGDEQLTDMLVQLLDELIKIHWLKFTINSLLCCFQRLTPGVEACLYIYLQFFWSFAFPLNFNFSVPNRLFRRLRPWWLWLLCGKLLVRIRQIVSSRLGSRFRNKVFYEIRNQRIILGYSTTIKDTCTLNWWGCRDWIFCAWSMQTFFNFNSRFLTWRF